MIAFQRPTTLDLALDLLSRRRWCVLAGGTDLYPAHVDRPFDKPVLDVTGLGDLRGITQDQDGWRIGGLTTWTDILRADLPPAFDGLKLAAREVGSVQIQNAGTIAGNLCNASPAADGVPPLLTLDAEVELTSAKGKRVLPLADFITGYRATARFDDELLTAVLVPKESGAGVGHFSKLGARKYLVISITMVAVRLVAAGSRVGGVRIALGACSPVACRLVALEQALVGLPLGEAADRVRLLHLAEISPIDDIRATARYRIWASLALVKRGLAESVRRLA